ncbi:(2Fe-2S)-binding protein [Hymenobacter sp. HSC-4F20]|nr:(2Fe-2S)-binding protein [Hymenobacter sp. HSC-4F20]
MAISRTSCCQRFRLPPQRCLNCPKAYFQRDSGSIGI